MRNIKNSPIANTTPKVYFPRPSFRTCNRINLAEIELEIEGFSHRLRQIKNVGHFFRRSCFFVLVGQRK